MFKNKFNTKNFCIICLISIIIIIAFLFDNNLFDNNLIELFKDLKNNGLFTKSVEKKGNNYIKKFNNVKGYNSEKYSYLRLKNNKHFPNIIDYNDNELSLTLEYAGIPIRKVDKIENLEQQLEEIYNSLAKNKIKHNDIMCKNLLSKDGVLKLIDFEFANDLSKNKEWVNNTRVSYKETSIDVIKKCLK